MTESFRPTPKEISRKNTIISAIKSERGEMRVGEAGGLAFIAGLFLVSEGANKNSLPEMAIGGGISGIILLEALITSLRKSKQP